MKADLALRHVRLVDRSDPVDVAISEGHFLRIGPSLDVEAARELDAAGRLATPPLVDSHLHLDASLTAGRPRLNESGTLIEGIELWGELKDHLTEEDVLRRARRVVRWAVSHGTLHIRAHADVSGANEAPLRVWGFNTRIWL